MPENDRFSGCLDEIIVEFLERDATLRLLMKLSIQFRLVLLSYLYTVIYFYLFGINRGRFPVDNRVHKANRSSETGRDQSHDALDETMIQRDDETVSAVRHR